MGKTTEAITVLEDALFEFENQRFYAACYHAFLADIHLQLGNDEKALRHVENLKEKYPEQRRYLGQGLLAEGHARLRAGNERTAVACWERARDDFPDFHDTLLSAELNLAKLSREKGLIEEALQRLIELEKLPRNQASLPHARIEAARLETLLSAGDLPEAEIVAQNIINRHFKHRVECAAALAHLSGILTCAGKFEEAEKAFARIENDFPEQRGARSEMMAYQLLAAYWHDDFNSAKRLCDQLLSNYSDQRHACATALSVTAALRRRDGHWDDAIAILENIAQARWERLMTTAMSMTERCMTEYMAQRPMRAHAVFLNILGQQGLLSEVFAKALKFSEETTIEDSPAHPLFLRNDLEFARALAWCFMKGNEERAVAHLRLCLEKTPGKVKMAWPAPAAKELLTFLEKSLARKKGRRVGAE
jgi:tetratricopeptide (TPR) repeat protein